MTEVLTRREARRGTRRDARRVPPARVVPLALLAVLLLAAGALLATVARPVERTTASLPAGTASSPVVVLSPQALGARDGEVVVSARGDGPVLVARGSAGDVEAWARGTTTTTATGVDDDGGLRVQRSGGGATAPDPAGSDLWTAQQRGDGSARLVLAPGVAATPDGTAVLVASDGTAAAPTRVEVTWSSRPVPLVAVLLLAAGAACAAGCGVVVFRALRLRTAEGRAADGQAAA